ISTVNSPGAMSRSMSRSAAWARSVPAAHTLQTLRHTTASREENGLNGLEATQHPCGFRDPVENPLLQHAQRPVGHETEHADERDREEHQRGIEGVARQHDDLAEAVPDPGR